MFSTKPSPGPQADIVIKGGTGYGLENKLYNRLSNGGIGNESGSETQTVVPEAASRRVQIEGTGSTEGSGVEGNILNAGELGETTDGGMSRGNMGSASGENGRAVLGGFVPAERISGSPGTLSESSMEQHSKSALESVTYVRQRNSGTRGYDLRELNGTTNEQVISAEKLTDNRKPLYSKPR